MSLHVSADGKYSLKVLFRDTTLRVILKEEKDISALLAVMENNEVCPGLNIKSVPEVNSASKRTWGFPFEKIDSNKCLLLHLPVDTKQVPGSVLFNVCKHCKKLYYKLNDVSKKRRRKCGNKMWTRRRHFGKIKVGMEGIQNIFYAFRKIEILSSYILLYDISLLSIALCRVNALFQIF